MRWWQFRKQQETKEQSLCSTPQALTVLAELEAKLQQFNQDPYIYWHESPLRLLSVFDELKYDRSDLDILSLRMRQHVATALKNIGCVQKSGHIILQPKTGIRFIMPKFVALGASPFATTRYHQRENHDYWVFTPTQAACFIIDQLPFDDALIHIEDLLKKQPINLYRILDFLENKPAHQSYRKSLKYLTTIQQQAITSEPLCFRKSL